MILQLIPLIALCCVLQRNRKPSHPSRHVVGAVVKKKTQWYVLVWAATPASRKGRTPFLRAHKDVKVFFGIVLMKTLRFCCKVFLDDREMIQLQVHLQLPCYDFCFLYWRNVGELPSRCKHPLVRSPALRHHRKQRRAVCTNGRDVIGTVWWAAPTRHSSLRDQ